MSPLRWDVLVVGFVLALPVIALGGRGDLTIDEVMNRVLWCLGAGWAAVALLRYASTPRTPVEPPKPATTPADGGPSADAQHSPV